MKVRLACTCLALVAAFLCAQPAAAKSSPSASALLAGASQLNDELALLGQGSSTLGLPSNRSLSELRFENSAGYTIAVVAYEQTVALSVTHAHGRRKGHGPASTTTYFAHGKVTPTSIAASFGDRGRIEVRFRPSGRKLRATRKAGCKRSGDGVLARYGVFAGELRFQGEGGFTSAEVHRVPGRSVDFDALITCLYGATPRAQRAVLPAPKLPWGLHLSGAGVGVRRATPETPSVQTHPSSGPKPTTLLADHKTPLTRTVFAAQAPGRGKVRLLALESASEGSIGVIRFVKAQADPSVFSVNRILSSASVKPPAPFSGMGAYEQGPGNARSWTGSLAVSFLGAPHIPLTGSPFVARLARGW
ncbi:MAG TPA: hypothetical protein VIP57_13470 [Candidatus Dormibacteraeota bacterium]